MSRSILKILFALVLCLSVFVGCSSKETKQSSSLDKWMMETDRLRVLSTTSMIGDLVQRIAQDSIVHQTLMDGTVDPHSYELVKGDDEKLRRAQLIFYNGLGLEHGASLDYALTHAENATPVGEIIATHSKEELLTVDGVIDPHIWMDIHLWVKTIDPIVAALSQALPEDKAQFEERAHQLKQELMEADETVYALMQSIPESKRYLVTSHDAFSYFARRYLAQPHELESKEWEKRFQAPEGIAPDGQLGLHDLEQIINHLERYHIAFVFPESNVSLNSLKKIHAVAAQKGIDIHFAKTPLFGDSMEGEGVAVSSYKEMVLHNAKVIEGFLHCEKE